MHGVLAFAAGVDLADGSFGGFGGVGCANQCAVVGNGVLLLQGDHHHRPARHKLNKASVEWAFAVNLVESSGIIARHLNHLQSQDAESGFGNHRRDLADDVLADCVRLDNAKCAFQSGQWLMVRVKLSWKVRLVIAPPCGNRAAGSFTGDSNWLFNRVALVVPAAPAAAHRADVGVAHPLQGIGSKD